MGPSMSIDGVVTAWRVARRGHPGFNGAVDEHRRSRTGVDEDARRSAGASMGPSMSIDGVVAVIGAHPPGPYQLQWGRR